MKIIVVKIDILKSIKQNDFERTKSCLEKLPDGNFLMAYESNNEENNDITFPDGILYKKLLYKIERTNFRNIKLPVLEIDKLYDNGNLDTEYLDLIMDWVGSVHNRIRK